MMNRKFLWIILLFFPFILLFSQEETPKEETEEIKGKYKGKIEEKKPTLDINFDPYKGEWAITLNANRVFTSERKSTISEQGKDLLREAADIVKDLFTRKLTIEVYSMNEKLSNKRAKVIVDWLLKHIIVPKYTVIHSAGYTDEVYKSSYIRIVL